jgi:hypothetical protein
MISTFEWLAARPRPRVMLLMAGFIQWCVTPGPGSATNPNIGPRRVQSKSVVFAAFDELAQIEGVGVAGRASVARQEAAQLPWRSRHVDLPRRVGCSDRKC